MMKFSVKDVICFMVLGIVSGCGASGSGVDSGSAANTVSAGVDKAVSADADASMVDSGSAADADKTESADASGVGTRGWEYSDATSIGIWFRMKRYSDIEDYISEVKTGYKLYDRAKALSENSNFSKLMKLVVDVYFDGKWWTGKEMYFKTGKFYVKGVRQSSDIRYSSEDFMDYYNTGEDREFKFENARVVLK